jgi:transposase
MRSYTDEFRADSIALFRRGGRTISAVAFDLGINHWTLRDWVRKDDMTRQTKKPEKSGRVPTEETADQKLARLERENARLQRENETLRMDREILKKAAAFFAKESE